MGDSHTLLITDDLSTGAGNTCAQFWKAREPLKALRMLSEWWNVYDVNRASGGQRQHQPVWNAFPWEQHAVNAYLWSMNLKEGGLGILDNAPGSMSFLQHIMSPTERFDPGRRKKDFTKMMADRMSDEEFLALVAKLKSSHTHVLNKSAMVKLGEKVAMGPEPDKRVPFHVLAQDEGGAGTNWTVITTDARKNAFNLIGDSVMTPLWRNGTWYFPLSQTVGTTTPGQMPWGRKLGFSRERVEQVYRQNNVSFSVSTYTPRAPHYQRVWPLPPFDKSGHAWASGVDHPWRFAEGGDQP